ncbi:DUF4376 domain-containing protein [Aeromonas allosaccharophila]
MIKWNEVITVSAKERQRLDRDYAQWKQERAAQVDAITVAIGDHVYQGCELSQGRMARAIAAATSDDDIIEWTLADNTVVDVSVGQLREVMRQAVLRQTAIWNEGRPVLFSG